MPSWSFPPTLASAFAPRLPPLAPLAGWRALGGIVLALALPGLLLMLAGRYPHRVVDPLLLTSAGTTLVSLSYIALVRTTEWRRVLELGVRPFPREFGIGLALGLLACATIAACDVALDAVAGIVMQDAATPDGRAIASAFVSSRQFALIEEIAFRGLLLRWLLGVTREGRAIAIQAAVFGLVHYPAGGWPHVVLATTMGAALGWAFLWRRSLWTPIAIHFAWDLFALFPGMAGAPATVVPAWLGPAEYGVVMVPALILAAGCHWLARRWASPVYPARSD
jgi:membrane protease YdiL (CAAX protease family)